MPLFVWVQGVNGPAPQIWHEDQTTGEGKAKHFLQSHKISKFEAERRIVDLMEDYPYAAPASA